MRTLDRLAESFLGGAALERPGLAFMAGSGKGGSSRRKPKPDDDDDDDDDDPDDDDDDDDPDDDDDDDDEADDDDLADMDEDELKAELRKVRDQLNRSTSGGAAKRKRIKRLRAELDEARKPKAAPAKTKPAAGGKGDEPEPVDVDAVKAVAKAEATAEANGKIIKAEARGALKAAGIPSAQVGRLVGMLKLDDIDIDDDGEVDEDSLDEAIEALRRDWPQLFPDKAAKRKPRTRVAGDSDSAGAGRGTRKAPTTTERQVAAALGKPLRK